jgi:hypothetical protein
VRAALFFVALASCGGSKSVKKIEDAQPRAVEKRFAFDWSPPCSVHVTDRILMQGNEIVLRYWVDVREHGGEITIEQREHVPLEVNGEDMTGPQKVAERAQVAKLFGMLPTWVAARDGTYLRADRVAETVRIVMEMEGKENDPTSRMMLESPDLLKTMGDKWAEPWLGWVSAWVGWDVPPGQETTFELPITGFGKTAAVQVTRAHLGEADGVAHLRQTERVTGDGLKIAMAPMMQSMMADLPPDSPGVVGKVDEKFAAMKMEGFRETTFEVWTDPSNLRPKKSRYEMRQELTIEDDPPTSQREAREADFDWAHAVGCGR